MDALRARGERDVRAVVDEEGRPVCPAGGRKRAREREHLARAPRLVAKLDQRDTPGQGGQRERDSGDQVGRGDQVEAGRVPAPARRGAGALARQVEPTTPPRGLEAFP
ncbi:MAG: hypothetical protein NVSMB23_21810 [Myxococcales bacterium]